LELAPQHPSLLEKWLVVSFSKIETKKKKKNYFCIAKCPSVHLHITKDTIKCGTDLKGMT
jgi:hypothetical protein